MRQHSLIIETVQPDNTLTSWASTGEPSAAITFFINDGETTMVAFTTTLTPKRLL